MSINELITYITTVYGNDVVLLLKKTVEIEYINKAAQQYLLHKWADLGRVDSVEVFINAHQPDEVLNLILADHVRRFDPLSAPLLWPLAILLDCYELPGIGLTTFITLVAMFNLLHMHYPQPDNEIKSPWDA